MTKQKTKQDFGMKNYYDDTLWLKGLLIAILIAIIIAGAIFKLLPSIDFSTAGERAEMFCKNNGMELKDLRSKGGHKLTTGNCVKIIDNQIVETREIVYVQSISNWVFPSGTDKSKESER